MVSLHTFQTKQNVFLYLLNELKAQFVGIPNLSNTHALGRQQTKPSIPKHQILTIWETQSLSNGRVGLFSDNKGLAHPWPGTHLINSPLGFVTLGDKLYLYLTSVILIGTSNPMS